MGIHCWRTTSSQHKALSINGHFLLYSLHNIGKLQTFLINIRKFFAVTDTLIIYRGAQSVRGQIAPNGIDRYWSPPPKKIVFNSFKNVKETSHIANVMCVYIIFVRGGKHILSHLLSLNVHITWNTSPPVPLITFIYWLVPTKNNTWDALLEPFQWESMNIWLALKKVVLIIASLCIIWSIITKILLEHNSRL